MIERWYDPAFLGEARAWIRAHVAVVGEIEQPHVRPWSTVLRVPTRDGDVFFKANALGFEHEARTLSSLVPLATDLLPELAAVDPSRGWMLVRDAGVRLRDRPEAARWDEVLSRYADLQLAAAPAADSLAADGVPDRRLERLPALYAGLGGVDVQLVEGLCHELSAFGIPETIQHDDLHDGQVFVRDGHARILDWGDACISHPFMTFAVTLSFAPDALDAYLARWSGYATIARLRNAVPIAMRLGGITRALTWAHVLPSAPPDWKQRFDGSIAAWLERVATPPERWHEDE